MKWMAKDKSRVEYERRKAAEYSAPGDLDALLD